MTATDTHRSIEAVWRIESARLIAGLARVVNDVGLAEDFAQEALIAAIEQWPGSGIPDNPGGWLHAVGKRRAIDHLRREARLHQKQQEIGRDIESRAASGTEEIEAVAEQEIEDDLLRLVFICCHPILSTDGRVALTLRLLGGLKTDEIARAFLTSEPTVSQRIVRAKKILSEARVQFEVPPEPERSQRLASVLEVIYLIFNEGYTATSGAEWIRPSLCEDALRLARILAGLVPKESEVHGLVALMELQASRLRARVDSSGRPVLLMDQDRARWDQLLIRRGFDALRRAEELGPIGPYGVQAAIAACHARARTAEETDWRRIAALYQVLARIAPSPVVELNRAVAVGMAEGPQAGLSIADTLLEEPSLKSYHLLPSVRGDFLEKLGRLAEAQVEFERAATLTRNERERALLQSRAAALAEMA